MTYQALMYDCQQVLKAHLEFSSGTWPKSACNLYATHHHVSEYSCNPAIYIQYKINCALGTIKTHMLEFWRVTAQSMDSTKGLCILARQAVTQIAVTTQTLLALQRNDGQPLHGQLCMMMIYGHLYITIEENVRGVCCQPWCMPMHAGFDSSRAQHEGKNIESEAINRVRQ